MFFLQDDTLLIPFIRASYNEYDVEPLVTACNPRFGDYQCNNAMSLWTKIRGKIGDGKRTFLWFDHWHPLGPLHRKFGDRVIYDSGIQAQAKLGMNGGLRVPRLIGLLCCGLSVIFLELALYTEVG
ncbi:hypothetical protein ACSBR2_032891 [Camellia fascicularis]